METVKDDPGDRDIRRRALARRLVGHEARTQHTFSNSLASSKRQFDYLRQRWGVNEDSRPRGPTHISYAKFFTSARLRSEAAVAGAMFQMFRASLAVSPKRAPSEFNFGELLCEVHEGLHTSFPGTVIDFDQLLLLVSGIMKGEAIGLRNCKCGATILVDLLLSSRRRICWTCQRKRRDTLEDESDDAEVNSDTDDGGSPPDSKEALFRGSARDTFFAWKRSNR